MGRPILLRVQDRSSGRQEHPADNRAVAGSNPAGPTITTGRTLLWNRSSVAQNTRLISGRSQVRVLAIPLGRVVDQGGDNRLGPVARLVRRGVLTPVGCEFESHPALEYEEAGGGRRSLRVRASSRAESNALGM
jgi:hypothetical protein